MFCNYCGNQIDDNSQFCPRCGKQLQTNTTAKTNIDLWLVLSIVSVLLLMLSISLSLSWGSTPLGKLDIEDTIPSALLGIAAIGVSGFNFFNEKKLSANSQSNSKRSGISILILIACLFLGAAFILFPFLGALS